MSTLPLIFDHLVPVMLVASRIAGLMLAAPLLSGRTMPVRVRAILAIMLGLAIYPVVPGPLHVAPEVDLFGLIGLVAGEALIGASLGLIASIPLAALEVSGLIMGHQMGLSLARSYNPELDAETEVLGQLLYYLAFAAFLALDGLETLFIVMARTFTTIPMGALRLADAPLDLLVGVLQSGFELAIRVAMPVCCIVILIMLAIGVLGKTSPQINVMSTGFGVKILCGLGVLALGVVLIQHVVGDEILRVLDAAAVWALEGAGGEGR